LQQVADAGISLILIVSFSLVLAGASVYIVSERVNGEKLQQKLCGVKYSIYWGVAFVWDFVVFAISIASAVIVFKIFNIPIYVDDDNLGGIIILLLFFGFAMIPGVHLFEKIFNEASYANMSFFCLNVIIALTTVSVIILFDVLGETDQEEKIRNFLNRAFLIFPQHALADGLIEICRNYITSKVFIRYYINTYRSPITSDLLRPHFTALIVLGCLFMILNYIIESGIIWRIFKKQAVKQSSTELKVITIQNTLTKDGKTNENDCVLKVENLYKSYNNGRSFAVNNVSFSVRKGECYGCLGCNAAGKSTIFSILSGETKRYAGTMEVANDIDKYSVSYCPQTNALDPLLTVSEIIEFYGKLRNIRDVNRLIEATLENFHLKPYRNVLVKNLSGGNRRKLSVACASFGSLSLVLMDEPVSDMDPLTRHLVYKTIRELNENNCSVILTSHSIAEVEDVCHSIGILVDGCMVASGSPESLKKEFGNSYVVTILSEKPLDYSFETVSMKTFIKIILLLIFLKIII
jgi:ABC-type multidrug transport system ATPase subunit